MKKSYHCPFEALIDILGGRWKLLILWRLNIHDFLRFGELQKIGDEASREILTAQLADLEREGFIQRVTYPEIPPRVEYHITDLGRSLWPVLLAMQEWSIDYLEKKEIVIEEEVLEEFQQVKYEHKLHEVVDRIGDEDFEEENLI